MNRPPRHDSAPDTTISPEVEKRPTPTALSFCSALSNLEAAMRNNPHSGFDEKTWLIGNAGTSDSAVYARVLDTFGTDVNKFADTELTEDQFLILDHINTQVEMHTRRAELALGDDVVAGASQELFQKYSGVAASASETTKQHLRVPMAATLYTASHLGKERAGPSELFQYEAAVLGDDEAAKEAAKEALQQGLMRDRFDAISFGLIAREINGNSFVDAISAAAPTPASVTLEKPTPAPTKESPVKSELATHLEEKLTSLRSEIAAMQARREKRMWGADAYNGEAIYGTKHKELYKAYHVASQQLFRLNNADMLQDGAVSQVEKVRRIAEYTVEEAKKLDLEILEKYKNTKTRFGKLLEKYGNMNLAGKILFGIGASALAGFATGGAGTFAVSGTLMAAGVNAKQRKARAAGGNMLNFDVDDIGAGLEDFDLGDLNDSQQVAKLHDVMNARVKGDMDRRVEKAQKKTGLSTVGSYAVAGALGYGVHHLPGGWLDGSNGFLHHDTASAMPGDGITPPHVPELPAVDPGNVMELHEGLSNIVAHPGMGMYEAAQHAGFNISQEDLLRAGPELYRHGLAYMMPDGLPGIPNPGTMPQATIDVLKYFATHH